MKAFFNDEKIKEVYLQRVTEHEKADEIIKGQYWENGKGCAVGCTIHSSNHADTAAAKSKWRVAQSEKLLELLREAE